MAEQIITAKAGYVLALKGNHPALPEEAAPWLDEQTDPGNDRQGP
ncbi:hypothetical protein [Azotobacter beijerinckii]|nr:hypothetical protein [Azotobacter beijerinckii]MDV7213042.1 hypothetical protein [Azotobacter beijerinckii]